MKGKTKKAQGGGKQGEGSQGAGGRRAEGGTVGGAGRGAGGGASGSGVIEFGRGLMVKMPKGRADKRKEQKKNLNNRSG